MAKIIKLMSGKRTQWSPQETLLKTAVSSKWPFVLCSINIIQ